MSGLVDIASGILAQSEGRAEVSAQNLSNTTTYGYKRRVSFSSLMSPMAQSPASSTSIDFTPGKLVDTHNPYDLAIAGDGFFCVRGPDGMLYTRQGQFRREADGRVVTTQGYALQTRDGGDLTVKGDHFQVMEDGAVLDGGQPAGRLAIVDATDRRVATPTEGGMFSAPASAMVTLDSASVRQGVLEASNVSTGEEMVNIMEALRRAETGQRLVGVYDDLMGRVLNSFGQA